MVAVDSFATAQQMEQRSKGAIPADRPFLDVELKAATRRIRNHCGWHIAESVSEVVTLRGSSARELYLPTTYLTDLVSVMVDGVALTVVDDGSLWSVSGELFRDFGWRASVIKAEIVHGYAAVPDDLIDLTLALAGRALASPLGAVREQSLTSSVTWSQPGFNVAGGLALLEHEIDALAEYKVGYTP